MCLGGASGPVAMAEAGGGRGLLWGQQKMQFGRTVYDRLRSDFGKDHAFEMRTET